MVDSILRDALMVTQVTQSVIDSPQRHLQLISLDFLMVHASSVRVIGLPGGSLRSVFLKRSLPLPAVATRDSSRFYARDRDIGFSTAHVVTYN